MADTFRFSTDRVRLEASEGQVWSPTATAFSVVAQRFVAGRDGWDRFLRYWLLRARGIWVNGKTRHNLTLPVPPRILYTGAECRRSGG